MNQTTQNRIEQAVTEHLLDRVRDMLTDRAGIRHAPPWEPKQGVRVGVLRPRTIRTPPKEAASGAATEEDVVAEEEARAAESDTTEPIDIPVLGLDFTVAADAAIELDIEVAFTLYHPELPTREEAQLRFSQLVESETEIAAAEAAAVAETDGPADEAEVEGGLSDAEAEERGGAEVDQSEDPGGQTGTAAAEPSAAASKRRSNVPVQHAWRREEVHAGPFRVSVGPDGEHHVVADELRQVVRESVTRHVSRPTAARPFQDKVPRTIPLDSLQSDAVYEAAIAERVDASWTPDLPTPEVTVFAEPLPDGHALVSVSLINTTVVEGRPFQDLALYDCRVTANVAAPAELVRQRFHLAPRDYRFENESEVIGHGRACVAVPDGANGVRSETLPTHTQMRIEPRHGHVPTPRWDDLASDPAPVLLATSDGMRRYLDNWDTWLAAVTDPDVRAAASGDRAGFADEHRRFDLGRKALERDGELLRAFQLANQAFADANAGKPFNSWRLFQLVYIIIHMPSLAARRHRSEAEFTAELDAADVLWFPTGGGKTEAYLGLLVTAAIYDRLRGKDRGVTAWLKFPLRMLSVQQLGRVLRVLTAAEEIRQRELGAIGSPFELGYLVGGGNTPNSLRWPSGWWPGFDQAVELLADTPGALDERRLVAQCPFCGAKKAIGIAVDADEYRIRHLCRRCDRVLPIHITDEEIFRYQPTVIVSTVDKITGFSSNRLSGEWTAFHHGPRLKCPAHGYLSFGKCSAGDRCKVKPRQYQAVTAWVDPVPALMIQDEMHLIREELGAFESHYEGLLAELQRGGPSRAPSKILAATATIEQFENQLSQVYGRHPRRFPSPGYERHRTFYIEETPDIRRTYLGVSPVGGGMAKVEVAAAVQVGLLQAVQDLQDDLDAARRLIKDGCGVDLSDDELQELLFNYEVTLGYVNSKPHGATIRDALGTHNLRLAQQGRDQIASRVVTSEVPLPELAEVIDLVEDGSLSTPRPVRIRAIVGTSVVSHGVDLERLNGMVMAGLPPTTADYIQATSRSGRTHIGVVVTVLDNFGRREASTFSNFISMHRFLERLVEPVPVNKYALNAVNRTLPGLVVALLWDLARDPASPYNPPAKGIVETRNLQRWWDASAALGLADDLLERLKAAYRSHVPDANATSLDDRLVEAAQQRWTAIERNQMEMWNNERTVELFRENVMTSLRDVDVPVTFGAMPAAAQIYEALFGREAD